MRSPPALLCLPLVALALTGCGASTTSVSDFSGEKREVAQPIANLQSAATAQEESKICTTDLAAGLVSQLGGRKGCEASIKSQLQEVDNLEATIESISLSTGASTASAQVRSIHEGKAGESTVTLVKEKGKWKISGVG